MHNIFDKNLYSINSIIERKKSSSSSFDLNSPVSRIMMLICRSMATYFAPLWFSLVPVVSRWYRFSVWLCSSLSPSITNNTWFCFCLRTEHYRWLQSATLPRYLRYVGDHWSSACGHSTKPCYTFWYGFNFFRFYVHKICKYTRFKLKYICTVNFETYCKKL